MVLYASLAIVALVAVLAGILMLGEVNKFPARWTTMAIASLLLIFGGGCLGATISWAVNVGQADTVNRFSPGVYQLLAAAETDTDGQLLVVRPYGQTAGEHLFRVPAGQKSVPREARCVIVRNDKLVVECACPVEPEAIPD